MTNETAYYNKILDAWIAKMKDKGFKFTTQESWADNGIELYYHRSNGDTNTCLIVEYNNEFFTVDKLFDRLHKLELIIPKLIEEPKAPILSIGLSYYLYSYYDGPYLIKRSTDLPNPNKERYYTYIENGQFKTVISDA